MDERGRHRALANGGGHALDRAVADVARHEEAGLAVMGCAPMKTNSASAPTSVSSPVSPSRSRTDSSWRSPRASTTSERARTATLGRDSIRSTRYRDIPSSSEVLRQTIVTLRATSARWSAAWPAEFAPPTTTTSWPRQSSASRGDEP